MCINLTYLYLRKRLSGRWCSLNTIQKWSYKVFQTSTRNKLVVSQRGGWKENERMIYHTGSIQSSLESRTPGSCLATIQCHRGWCWGSSWWRWWWSWSCHKGFTFTRIDTGFARPPSRSLLWLWSHCNRCRRRRHRPLGVIGELRRSYCGRSSRRGFGSCLLLPNID